MKAHASNFEERTMNTAAIAVVDLKDWFAAHPNAVLLDVREDWEHARAAIRVAGVRGLHIPMLELSSRLHELEGLQPVVCYCHHGLRSQQVVAFLAHRGHESVYNLVGGIDAWSMQVDAAVPRY